MQDKVSSSSFDAIIEEKTVPVKHFDRSYHVLVPARAKLMLDPGYKNEVRAYVWIYLGHGNLEFRFRYCLK